jgi:hypothetical protein
MNHFRQLLISAAVGGAALLAMPMAHADKTVINHYYGASDYGDRHEYREHHRQRRYSGHDCDDCGHRLVRNYYYDAPVRERVVVVERPVYYEEPTRYYDAPVRYYDDAPGGYTTEAEYRSATPTIVGGILGGLAGHEMGQGRGKGIATVAGVILGGSIGRDLGR